MIPTFGPVRLIFFRKLPVAVTAITMFILASMAVGLPVHAGQYPYSQTLRGTVEGNGHAQRGYTILLYAAEAGGHGNGHVLGTARTDLLDPDRGSADADRAARFGVGSRDGAGGWAR